VPNIDRPFLEQVWRWLVKNPEIRVGEGKQHKQVSLLEAEVLNGRYQESDQSRSVAQTPAQAATSAASYAGAAQPIDGIDGNPQASRVDEATVPVVTPERPSSAIKHTKDNAGIRLYTSDCRMWYALTGHGPDLNRIKALDFVCLSIIAACGAKGILQPQLAEISGQDKRSVPERTDRLNKAGYVKKKPVSVLVHGIRTKTLHTSVCVLTRFANGLEREWEKKPGGHEIALKRATGKNFDRNVVKRKPQPGSIDEKFQSLGKRVQDSAEPEPESEPTERLTIAQWTADRSVGNQIVDLVHRSGMQGMTLAVRL